MVRSSSWCGAWVKIPNPSATPPETSAPMAGIANWLSS
nr:MAG TPA_asm: hypothetical protein [Caudoviricetes sp.]